jgi:hypothetical protein
VAKFVPQEKAQVQLARSMARKNPELNQRGEKRSALYLRAESFSVALKKSFRWLEGRHFDGVSEYRRPLDTRHRILLRAKDSTWAFKKKRRREFSSQGSGTTIAKLQVRTERI